MRQNQLLCLLFGLLAISAADSATYSLGDINQYSGSVASSPTLSGAVVAFSGAPDKGIDVFISSDLQGKIRDAVNSNCQEINNKCYQSVRELLVNPNTELNARQAGELALLAVWAIGLIAMVIPLLEANRPLPIPIHVPSAQVSQASAAASASVIVVATGSGPPAITITQKPGPTTVTGSKSPAITTFTSAVNGHTQGDMVTSMPEDLARRMDELIRRSTECNAAGEASNRPQKRDFSFGNVICAAEAVIINAAPGTAFADYLVVHPQPLPWTLGDAVRAMNVVSDFARAYAPALQLNQDTAAAVGVGAFAVAWEVLINNKALTTDNVIPVSSLMGTTSAPCSLTSADDCTVNCRMIGAIERCGTTCTTQTSCGATSVLKTATTVPWTVVAETTAPAAAPLNQDCNLQDSSGFPYNVFTGVYGQFCAEVDKTNSPLTWIVDSHGNKIPQLRIKLHERTPPPNPDTYKDYRIDLEWTPGNTTSTTCASSCSGAYGFLANSPCGHTAGEQNIMTTEASVDVGCGSYSYKIEAPPKPQASQPPSLGSQQCHEPNAFGKDVNTDSNIQNEAIKEVCDGSDHKFMQAGDPPLDWQKKIYAAPYHFIVSWIDECKFTDTHQNVMQPLPDHKDDVCPTLLRQDWQNCGNNGGRGGWRDAGCLRYEFKAQM